MHVRVTKVVLQMLWADVILSVLLCRKPNCTIIPTFLLSDVTVETHGQDETEQSTLPPLHAGTVLRFLTSYNTKMTINVEE